MEVKVWMSLHEVERESSITFDKTNVQKVEI